MFISILIPHYNGINTILETIQSIYSQSYTNFEVIVCDDGSIPSNLLYLERLQKIYNFHLLKNNENMGVTQTLIKCFKFSKGNYISIIGQDDILFENALEVRKNNIGVKHALFSDGIRYNKITKEKLQLSHSITKKEYYYIVTNNKEKILNILYTKFINCCQLQSGLFKKDVINYIAKNVWSKYNLDDWGAVIHIYQKYDICYLNEPLYYYVISDYNTTKNFKKIFLDSLEIIIYEAPSHLIISGVITQFMYLMYNMLKSRQITILKLLQIMITSPFKIFLYYIFTKIKNIGS